MVYKKNSKKKKNCDLRRMFLSLEDAIQLGPGKV